MHAALWWSQTHPAELLHANLDHAAGSTSAITLLQLCRPTLSECHKFESCLAHLDPAHDDDAVVELAAGACILH